jgi:hypothetical protein
LGAGEVIATRANGVETGLDPSHRYGLLRSGLTAGKVVKGRSDTAENFAEATHMLVVVVARLGGKAVPALHLKDTLCVDNVRDRDPMLRRLLVGVCKEIFQIMAGYVVAVTSVLVAKRAHVLHSTWLNSQFSGVRG